MADEHKTETVEYLNSDGSPGGRLDRAKYQAVRAVLLDVIPADDEGVPYAELAAHVQERVPAEMLPAKGSASWLATTVKLDLEGRRVIERVPGSAPQRLRKK